jgi:hypothetical protein
MTATLHGAGGAHAQGGCGRAPAIKPFVRCADPSGVSGRRLFCVLACVSLLGHGAHLLLSGARSTPTGATAASGSGASHHPARPWLCKLL